MKPRQITIVTSQLLGYDRTGGVGTATTFLAIALARIGHRVDVLYVGDSPPDTEDGEWAQLYGKAGVRIRSSSGSDEGVEPGLFARMRAVDRALLTEPPDVVIAQDCAAPAYTALRRRQAGLGLDGTLFVALCHGTRWWVKKATRNARVSPDVLSEAVLERASIELADVAVSPSAYMLDWMRRQGWSLPDTTVVIPLLTRSGATGEPPAGRPDVAVRHVERIVFFGRLEERKGLTPFLFALNALEPELLEGVELEFIGRTTKHWPPDRVEGLLAESVLRLARLSFRTDLDQAEALARLGRPGTLAVMPSIADNSPNTVYECLERGIPFITSNVGGIPELISPEDRVRVLFEPTPAGIAKALGRALSEPAPLRPAPPAFDAATSLERWAEVVAMRPRGRARLRQRPPVDVVVLHRRSQPALERCLSALTRQCYRNFALTVVAAGRAAPDVAPPAGLAGARVVGCEGSSVEAAREAGLRAGSSPWVVFLDEEDVPGEDLLETLVRAQAASRADVVTCGLYLVGEGRGRSEHLFMGQPQGLGLLANGYGTIALIRRSLLAQAATAWPAQGDPDWPLLARLSAAGAQMVSVPLPLATRTSPPGTLEDEPSDALLVVQELERALPNELRSLARLAAGLAAEAQRLSAAPPAVPGRRALRRLTGRPR